MVVTRFAPSPTGYLHIGGLRTALFCYLHSKKMGGKFRLRIEDTDLKRNKQEATDAIIEAFNWVNLKYDGELIYQSDRFDVYDDYIDKLVKDDKAYYCYMDDEDVKRIKEEQRRGGQQLKYLNPFRDSEEGKHYDASKKPVVRLKTPMDGAISWVDGVKGEISIDAKEVDDFVLRRGDGVCTYNFVVVVDDIFMEITDVMRGDDHTSNTPKQISLYNALGAEIPKFYHIPMIHNTSGKKLSKRDGATDVMMYKKEGFLKEALLNFLVRLGWSHGDEEIFSMDELEKLFDANDINKSASVYNYEKLLWLNQHYIKELDLKDMKNLSEEIGVNFEGINNLDIFLNASKTRIKTLKEIENLIIDIKNRPETYDESALKKASKESFLALKELKSVDFLSSEKIDEDLHAIMDKFSLKPAAIFMPLRVALIGKKGGIDLSALLISIGKEECVARVGKFIDIYEKGYQ